MGRKIKRLITHSFLNDRGKIRLRWRFNSIRYTLSTSLTFNDENLILAKEIGKLIKADIRKDKFDTTLEKYKNVEIDTPIKPKKGKANTTPQ